MKYETPLGNDISLIDTGLMGDEVVACYLLKSGDKLAIIETGNYQTADRILEVLNTNGLKPEQVTHIIVTHVHLDHAGGASHLIAKLPNAQLVVHPSGAKHMINPDNLINASTQVYGEKRFKQMYGDIAHIPSDRVIIAEDGDKISVGNRLLEFHHTPGHAYHHFCIWDELDQSWFTGDTFGLCYMPLKTSPKPLVVPTTTPTQFDPEALKSSVSMLLRKLPKRVHLTHYGPLDILDHEEMKLWLHKQIDDYVAITLRHASDCADHHELAGYLLNYYQDLVTEHHIEIDADKLRQCLSMDMELNAQGLYYWFNKHHS